ncbi:hypothetical protein F5148DRAFT_986813, partial [Russula earlei]
IADEALHLTAAMQYCGFRSVVGTMWGMADSDGPELVGALLQVAVLEVRVRVCLL